LRLLLQYIIKALQGQIGDISQWKIRQKTSQYVTLIELLPLIADFLLLIDDSQQEKLLEAFTDFYQKCPTQSAAKSQSLLLMNTILFSDNINVSMNTMNSWISSLPRLLWQLGATNNSTVETLINLLHKFITHNLKSVEIQTIFEDLQSSLVPFFFCVATNKQGLEKKVFGPFINLSVKLQQRMIQLLYYFRTLSDKIQLALVACSTVPQTESIVIKQIIELLIKPQLIPSPEQRLNMVISILVGLCTDPFSSKKADEPKSSISDEKCIEVSGILANALSSLKIPRSKILELLEKPFIQVLESRYDSQIQKSILHFLSSYLSKYPSTDASFSPRLKQLLSTQDKSSQTY